MDASKSELVVIEGDPSVFEKPKQSQKLFKKRVAAMQGCGKNYLSLKIFNYRKITEVFGNPEE
jgi:hypothetical protein